MGIPTNLVTGFLGVGKTTAVIDLLRTKPPGAPWAVLVNEYGEVAIDGALIEGAGPDGVTVREVGGGCVCCASAPYLGVALHFLLLDAKPERLIIETTGLGHPARLLDTLRTDYAGRLELRATLAIVDPADFARPEMKTNAVFVDQIQMADVVVMNKLDTATPELVADFQAWANGLYPPKLLVVGTTHGRLDPAWLDLSSSDERLPLYPAAHENHLTPPPPSLRGKGEPIQDSGPLTPPSLLGKGAGGLGSSPPARGWVFPPAAAFDEDRLLALLRSAPGVTRLKGVFRLADDWVAVNRAGATLTVAPTAYRRDSRLEAFADAPDWDAFERALLACQLPNSVQQ